MREFAGDEVSIVEDLTPEGPPRGRLWQVRELLMGLFLVAVVLAWGGWEWWRQVEWQSGYRQAQQAATEYDWDRARALYASVSGYKDAEARAGEAARLVSDRDKAYEECLFAIERENWAVALGASRAVQVIQPDFRDIDRLAAQVEEQAYRETLSGTVVMRTWGERPGLYYRTGDAWVWLEGSDRRSTVLGIGTPDHVVYDVPAEVGSDTGSSSPTGNPYLLASGSPGMWGRRLVAAAIDDRGLRFIPLAYHPAMYNFYTWGSRGVWAMRYRYDSGRRYPPGVRSGYSGYDLTYQPFGSTASVPVSLPGPEWVVLDLAADGEHMLVARMSLLGASREPNNLYVTGPDGSNPRLVLSYNGGFWRAQFGPDGRYALVTTYDRLINYRSEQHRVFLLDLAEGSRPVRLAEDTVSSNSVGSYPVVSALFLRKGPLAGKILLGQWAGSSSFASLRDPANPREVLARGVIYGTPGGTVWVGEDEARSRVVLGWSSAYRPSTPYTTSLTLAVLSLDAPLVEARLPQSNIASLMGLWVRGDALVYGEKIAGETFSVRGLPLRSLADPAAGTNLLYTSLAPSLIPFTVNRSWSPGSGQLAYTHEGQLRLRTYDGAVDLPLESGIDTFYDFSYSGRYVLR